MEQKIFDILVQIQNQVTGLQGQVNGLQDQVNGLQSQVNGLQDQVNGLQGQVNGLQDQVNGLQGQVNGLQDQVNGLQTQVNGMESRLDNKIEAVRQEILDQQFLFEQEYGIKIDAIFDAVTMELDKNLEKSEKLHKLEKRMDRNDVTIFSHEKRISNLELKR